MTTEPVNDPGDDVRATACCTRFPAEIGSVGAELARAYNRDAGIAGRTLERARAILNVTTRKDKGGWWISLPPSMTESNQNRHTANTNDTGGVAANEVQHRHPSLYGGVGDVDAPADTVRMADLAIFPKLRGEFDGREPDNNSFQCRQPEPGSVKAASVKTANL